MTLIKCFVVSFCLCIVFAQTARGNANQVLKDDKQKQEEKTEIFECEEVPVEELSERWRKMNGNLENMLGLQAVAAKKPKQVSETMKNEILRKAAWRFKSALQKYVRRKEKRKGKGKNKQRNKQGALGLSNAKTLKIGGSQCYTKGTPDSQGLLRLCTECVGDKFLDSDRFPDRLREVSCSSTDSHCLFGDGKCVQKYANVVVLKRTDKCVVCNGVSKREWVPDTLLLKVGCFCRLLPGSVFSLLV